MTRLPSRLRRLDDALDALPVEDPLLLSELDGYLTGIAVCPETIVPASWLPVIWGGEGEPFEDPIDSRWFVDAVVAHHDAIVRDLSRGKPQPLFDIDERNGEILWDAWACGFDMAVATYPDVVLEPADDFAAMAMLATVARDESGLDADAVNAVFDAAPTAIPRHLVSLFGQRSKAAPVAMASAARPGRNDPCPCGSGRKSKRCCAAG